ncbi:hypothetical protein FHG87_017614 [Trinorchestia longiramus]|nr:hypothetical protein FHG87_017614 [Trinorchestia longiramus]
MSDILIEAVQQHRDLGVIVTENLKHDKQVEKSVRNVTPLVRPHLEYAVQLWSPTLRRDINKMGKIQRKATKLIPELRNLSYKRRLQQLELISLEQRRLRGQLIETYKYLNGLNHVTLEALFQRDNNVRTRNKS